MLGKLLCTINQSHTKNTDYSTDMKNKTVLVIFNKLSRAEQVIAFHVGALSAFQSLFPTILSTADVQSVKSLPPL